jgi:hypothetical protein
MSDQLGDLLGAFAALARQRFGQLGESRNVDRFALPSPPSFCRWIVDDAAAACATYRLARAAACLQVRPASRSSAPVSVGTVIALFAVPIVDAAPGNFHSACQ